MKFKFLDKGETIDTCEELASCMPYFNDDDVELLIKQKYVADQFDKDKVNTYANELCRIDNMNIYLMSQRFKDQVD